MNGHKFPYEWYLKDGYPANGIEKHGLKVFGTFICGGGSTMGYKLAGFDHLGGVEIDPQVANVYKANHQPKFLFNMDIREFNKKADIPEELFDLDLLDGSPPCSSFSMAGNREKDWGKEKVFREGQAKQTLDDLFFDYIFLANRLQPKVFIAENVKGLIQGNAKAYVNRIFKEIDAIGYNCQLFLLNAASMGVPQKRERVFFICSRKDLNFPKLKLEFNEKAVLFGEVKDKKDTQITLRKCELNLISHSVYGDKGLKDAHKRLKGKESFFCHTFQYDNNLAETLTANSGGQAIVFDLKRHFNKTELLKIGSYPIDYNFLELKPKYLIGMSVPPVMTAQIAHQIYLQWLKH